MNLRLRTLTAGVLFMLACILAARPAGADTRAIEVTTYLRAGPGRDYRPADEALSGRMVDVLGCASAWCRIRMGGQTGWVAEGALAPNPAPIFARVLPDCFVGQEAGRREGRDVRFCHAQSARP